MKITTPYGSLVFDENTSIPLTITNPVFNEQGSHSLPFTIPWCNNNLVALGNPDIITNSTRPVNEIEATLEADFLYENGLLILVDFEFGISIELSFLTREGMFWKWAKENNLPDIDFPTDIFDGNGWVDNLNEPYPTGNAAMFPLIVSDTADYKYLSAIATAYENIHNYDNTYDYKRLLNNFDFRIDDFVTWEIRSVDYKKDRSVFLYVNSVIDWIFQTYGYAVVRNDLTDIDELNRLCILNNACYAFIDGQIYLPYLVPDISIQEFIASISTRFNVTFFIDSRSRQVSIIFNDDIISAADNIVEILANVRVKDLVERGIEITHTTISDSLAEETPITEEELTANFGFSTYEPTSSFDPNDNEILSKANDPDDFFDDRITFFKSSQMLCIDKAENAIDDEDGYAYYYRRQIIGAKTNQYETAGENVKQLSSKVALAPAFLTQLPTFFYEYDASPPYDIVAAWFNNAKILVQAFRVALNDIDTRFSDNPTLVNTSNNRTFPLAFTIFRGLLTAEFVDPDPEENYELPATPLYPYASPYPYDSAGALLSESAETEVYPDELSLQVMGTNGLKERFFKHTSVLFEDGANMLSLENFRKHDFFRFNFQNKCLTNSLLYLINKVEITITPFKTSIDSIEAISLKPFNDRIAPFATYPVIYGLLYNFFAVIDVRNIANGDFVVPEKTDWDELTSYIETNYNVSPDDFGVLNHIKSKRQIDSPLGDPWDTEIHPRWAAHATEYGRDSVSLNGKPSGMRYKASSNVFFGIGVAAMIWSKTSKDENDAYMFGYDQINYSSGTYQTKKTGAAIRLVRATTEAEDLLSDGSLCELYIGNDGKGYKTVKIGNQVWTEHLAETEYANGDSIPIVEEAESWAALSTGACCAYNNDYSYVPMTEPE